MSLSAANPGRSRDAGVELLAAAILMYTVVAACCSSPQTCQINAGTRAPTLMKWVDIGLAQGAGFVLIAAILDRKNAAPILAGGGLAGAVLYVSYVHARDCGLASAEPGTETPSAEGGYVSGGDLRVAGPPRVFTQWIRGT